MDNSFTYAVLGSGRWSRIIGSVLSKMGRRVGIVSGIRQATSESDGAYGARVAGLIPPWAEAVWIAVPPGPHVAHLVRAALTQGRHVIVEKPWQASMSDSLALTALADRQGLQCVVHHQYPQLDAVIALSKELAGGQGLGFEGFFTLARASLSGIPPLPNLGSHLISIWQTSFPLAQLRTISVGYEIGDRRAVRIGDSEIDFTGSSDPIIQRFVTTFERSGATAAGIVSLPAAATIDQTLRGLERRPPDIQAPNLQVWEWRGPRS